MSKITIVNEQDEVIGVKERYTLDKEDISRISALWISNSKGQVLLAQRSLQKPNAPGKWGPAVAGTVEDGETYQANIIKEAEEEIGLSGIEFKMGPKEFVQTNTNYFCQWFFATVDKEAHEFTLQQEEVEQVQWFEPDQLVKEIHSDPDKFTYSMYRPERLHLLGLA